jgi:hypothetical protein
MAFLLWCGLVTLAFFLLAAALEALGLLDDPPCDCLACTRARAVPMG